MIVDRIRPNLLFFSGFSTLLVYLPGCTMCYNLLLLFTEAAALRSVPRHTGAVL